MIPGRFFQALAPVLKNRANLEGVFLSGIDVRARRNEAENVRQGRFRRVVRGQTDICERKGGALIKALIGGKTEGIEERRGTKQRCRAKENRRKSQPLEKCSAGKLSPLVRTR